MKLVLDEWLIWKSLNPWWWEITNRSNNKIW